MEIQRVVIGTAGHIDHGKSSLVRALTGIDPDRLKEEKERGLTIDLGFARFELPDGRLVGIVDVPGHERFVRNMVAGAAGIDLVILVVAADDGVMPQTREHLDIMRVLGVERGIVALNKIDLVDPELVELALEDIAELVAGTFLEGAPVLPISAVAGTGLDELRAELVERALETPSRSAEGVFRMSVQRAFTKQGFGTVATGIPHSGTVALGDTLEVLPSGVKGKVRGLHAYGESAELGRAGHSTAINFSDVPRTAIERGSVVATPGFFRPVRMLGARFTSLESLSAPIGDRIPVRVHIGTSDPRGELVLLDCEEIAPGGQGLVQVRLEEPVVCAPGDRFVIRRLSPVETLGGGVVLEESRHRLKKFKRFVLEELSTQERSLASPEQLLDSVLSRAGVVLSEAPELARAIKCTLDETREFLKRLERQERARRLGKGERWIHSSALERGAQQLRAALDSWFEENSGRELVDVRDLRAATGWEAGLLDAFLQRMGAEGDVELESGGRIRPLWRQLTLDPEEVARRELIVQQLEEAALQPPDVAELARLCKASPAVLRGSLEGLEDGGAIVRVAGDLFVARSVLDRAREAVIANCEQHGHLEIPALRDTLGTSRKYLIPILEYFDTEGVTLRQGAHRVLRKRQ